MRVHNLLHDNFPWFMHEIQQLNLLLCNVIIQIRKVIPSISGYTHPRLHLCPSIWTHTYIETTIQLHVFEIFNGTDYVQILLYKILGSWELDNMDRIWCYQFTLLTYLCKNTNLLMNAFPSCENGISSIYKQIMLTYANWLMCHSYIEYSSSIFGLSNA